MSKSLPSRPNLEQLKNQAKDLLKLQKSGAPEALKRVQENHPDFSATSQSAKAAAKFTLSDAQFVIAREYGFASWPKLKEQVESLASDGDPLEALAAAVRADDAKRAARIIELHPGVKSKLNDPMPNGDFGGTFLLAAVHRTNRQMIDVLLGAGADINGRSDWWAGGFGVLDNDHGLAPFLIERGAIVDAHAAARLGMFERLKELVVANPEVVHARGGDGQTPLHFASSIQIAEYLLDHGADINAQDVDHESTPAQYMARDRQEIVRYLVSRGCRTDILMAAALGDLALVHKHIDANPESIRMRVSDEYFPKQNPRSGGTIYIWVLGANKTAHSVARAFGHEEIFRFLMDRSSNKLKLALACELGDESLFKALLANHPNLVQTLSEHERAGLAFAARDNNTQAVRLMLEAGWPVDARGQHGGTALHWAAFHGNAAMTEIILRHNPPIEVKDADFDGTPLGWAIHGSENGWHCKTGDYARTVEALLKAGAKRVGASTGTDAVRAVIERYREKE